MARKNTVDGGCARRAGARFGFGRVELLAVIACAGLFSALLFPQLQSARDRARRDVCLENLRQIGTALGAYHDLQGSLSPAAVWQSAGLDLSRIDTEPWAAHAIFENWARAILPHVGHSELAARFDASAPVIDDRNSAAREAEVGVFTCPADSYHRRDNLYVYGGPIGGGARFARGNYAINGGSQVLTRWPGTSSAPAAEGYRYEFDPAEGTFAWYGNGVAGINRAFQYADFANGRATTIAVEEVRSGIHEIDPRGVWALGQIASSVTWGHGVTGDDAGPNNSSERADDIVSCGDLHKLLGDQALLDARMPCVWYYNYNSQMTARSMHPGGVQLVMADGAARFVADEIDRGVWHAIHSRECPSEVLSEVPFDRSESGLSEATPPRVDRSERPESSDDVVSFSFPRQIENSLGMRLALIEEGAFMMGVADVGEHGNVPAECPPHLVRLTRPFYIGCFEVTQDEYEQVMGGNPSWHSRGRAFQVDHVAATGRVPVDTVAWEDAAEFCRRLTELPAEQNAGLCYRLPTEAEWEYVCRAGGSAAYEWSAAPDPAAGDNAGSYKNPSLGILAVGSYPPNALGVYDMRGNLFEWCHDWYHRAYYAQSPVNDPRGPAHGYLRLVRGSDWIFCGEGCTIHRWVAPPWLASRYIGVRVVAEPSNGAPLREFAASEARNATLAVFTAHRNPQQAQLVLLDAVARAATLLRDDWNTSPSWDPTGTRLAVVNGKDLLVLDPASGAEVNVTMGRFRQVADPAWSPDGKTILFAAIGEHDYWMIFTVPEAGGEPRHLLPSGTVSRLPAWLPDGREILFVESDVGNWSSARLVVTGPTGGKRRTLISDVPLDAAPAWSPDGTRFAFSHWGETRACRQLCIASSDGTIASRLNEDDQFACFPAWSPDGLQLAYVEYETDVGPGRHRGSLMLHDLAKREARVVSRDSVPRNEHGRPAWRPANQDVRPAAHDNE